MTNLLHHPAVDSLLMRLLEGFRTILGDDLRGVYVYGSLVWGDFDPDISDVDLLVATAHELSDTQFDALDSMHRTVTHNMPEWDNRIEIAYLSLHALKVFKTERHTFAVMSPGEPFHRVEWGNEYLMNWYMVQTYGLTLYGAAPAAFITPVTKTEFIDGIRDYIRNWVKVSDDMSRGYQAYTILTLCRALYTFTHGEQVSKRRAALWTAEQFPEWSDLIHNALQWRASNRDQNVDHAATLPQTRRFVTFMINHILTAFP